MMEGGSGVPASETEVRRAWRAPPLGGPPADHGYTRFLEQLGIRTEDNGKDKTLLQLIKEIHSALVPSEEYFEVVQERNALIERGDKLAEGLVDVINQRNALFELFENPDYVKSLVWLKEDKKWVEDK